MLNTSSCPGNRWRYILLIVLGGLIPGLVVVASIQAQITTPARQADPDNAEQVALGQQVYACMRAFAPAVTGAISKASPIGRRSCHWAISLPRRTMRPATPGTMPTSGCSKSSSTGANTMPPHAIAAPCQPIKRCSPTPRPGLCWPSLKAAGLPPSGRSRSSRMLVIAKGVCGEEEQL
jgi:hypothetical protein